LEFVMPFEVKLSQLQDREQFEQAVAEHANKLAAFNRVTGTPRPVAHPLIEASVKRIVHPKNKKLPDDFVVDYVLVDDSPPEPAPLNLQDRKSVLMAELRAAEMAAKEAVFPQRKHRLLHIQATMALGKREVVNGKWDNSKLSAEELGYAEKAQEVQTKYAAIELVAAQAESDIEDLTDDTIDKWQVPNFG
jgi:hypothetical protein